MKKLLAILMSLALSISLTACGDNGKSDGVKDEDVSLDTAVWEGYPDMPLVEAFEKALDGYGDSFEVHCEKGWSYSEELDEDSLPDGLEPYTYIIEVDHGSDIESWYFFMTLDDDDTLTAFGSAEAENGDSYEMGASESDEFLAEIIAEFDDSVYYDD